MLESAKDESMLSKTLIVAMSVFFLVLGFSTPIVVHKVQSFLNVSESEITLWCAQEASHVAGKKFTFLRIEKDPRNTEDVYTVVEKKKSDQGKVVKPTFSCEVLSRKPLSGKISRSIIRWILATSSVMSL